MWNGKCVQEEDGGRHFVHDFDQYYSHEIKIAHPKDIRHYSYKQCYSPSGNCYSKRDLSNYPYDPFYRPNAPAKKPMVNRTQTFQTPTQINNDYMYDEQFQTFNNPRKQLNDNSSKCCGDTLPQISHECQRDIHNVPGIAIRDRFCLKKNTEINKNKNHSIVPSWLEANNDQRQTKRCFSSRNFNIANQEDKKFIAKCYPKSVYSAKNSRHSEHKSFRPGAPSEEKVLEFLGSYITRKLGEGMDSYIRRCASAAKIEVQREHRTHVGIESNNNLDKYVKNLVVGTQLGQLAHGVKWSLEDCNSIEKSLKDECQKLANNKQIDLNDYEFK